MSDSEKSSYHFAPIGEKLRRQLMERLEIKDDRTLRAAVRFEQPGLVSLRVDFLVYPEDLEAAIKAVCPQERPQ